MLRGKTIYLPTLDGWRAVAISLVVFCHASVGLGLGQFKDVGLLGVQIFFGLSGFLITTLLLNEEERNGSISLRGFYTRRVFRIIPAAATFLLIVGLLSIGGVIHISLARWLSSLFFMANYSLSETSWYVGHFWSLAVEEHFYLVWPAVLLFVPGNRKRLTLAIGAALAVALWRAVDFKFRLTWTDSAWFWGRTDINADGILFGVIYALALRDAQIAPALKRALSNPLAAPLSIAVFVLTAVLPSALGWKMGFILITVRAAAVPAMLLATLHNPTHLLGRMLELKPLCFLGLISYSLYLWQQLFLVWEPNPALHPVQWFPVNIGAAALCAVLSFYLVETPLIRLGRSVFASARVTNLRQRNSSPRPVRSQGDDGCDAVM